ncbi:hypothetical protein SESBI_46073 [Sesbania bispinosa]|nr:hypothetical protein SESBI_46073 [Sesbania bispinosa]
MAIPEAVDSILGKILAFKIKVLPKYKHCSVMEISEIPNIIESIIEKIPNYEDAVTNQKEKSICSSLKEFELHESQSLSVTGNFDPAKIDCLTPSKRLTSDEFAAQEINEGQFSTTKFIKHIKTE